MKLIQVLGTGCPKCKKLEEITRLAVKEANLECEVEKVTDINTILKFGIMMTPALVVDGEVKASGRVPSVEEIKTMIQ